jgi:hypothetical protein
MAVGRSATADGRVDGFVSGDRGGDVVLLVLVSLVALQSSSHNDS